MENTTAGAQSAENKEQSNLDKIIEDTLPDKQNGDDSKQEHSDNPYEEELKRLREENTFKSELISNKNRAIESLKKSNQSAETTIKVDQLPPEETIEINGRLYVKADIENIKELNKKELMPLFEEKIRSIQETFFGDRKQQALEQASSDPSEREVMKWHLENSIVPSGDINADIRKAKLLANEKIIYNEGRSEGLEARRNDVLTSFATHRISGSRAPQQTFQDEDKKEAADMLTWLKPEAKKHL